MKQGIRRDLKDFHGGGIPDYSRLFPTFRWSGVGQISIQAFLVPIVSNSVSLTKWRCFHVEKVLSELKRRKENDTFDGNALDAAIRKYPCQRRRRGLMCDGGEENI